MTTEPAGPQRWRIHRGGVVNIWQFAEQTFDYSGGRVIYQGTNGSGKSRTLELQMPLPLDGSLSYMGTKGYGSTSMRQLLMEGYDGGSTRVGYAWLELRRVTEEGAEEFLTCGIGAKASKHSQDLGGSWRFATDKRIGRGLELIGPDGVPLETTELKKAVGIDNVYGSDQLEAYQRRIAGAVYGIDEHRRYADLLNLQRTLRNPDIGIRAEQGHLAQNLSDALPPLDPDVIKGLAEKYTDLQAITGNIKNLTEADSTLQKLLAVYRSYVRSQFDQRATALRKANSALATYQQNSAVLRRTLSELESDVATKAAAVTTMEGREAELATILGQLELPAELRDIAAKNAEVAALQRTAASLAAAAGTSQAAEDRAVDAVTAAARATNRTRGQALSQTHGCRTALATAGLDRGLVPVTPAEITDAASTITMTVRTGPDPHADLADLVCKTPPEIHVDRQRQAVEAAQTQTALAAQAAAERLPMASALAHRAGNLNTQHGVVEQLRGEAERAAAAVEEAVTHHRAAALALKSAAEAWVAQADDWIARAPADAEARAAAPPVPDAEAAAADQKPAERTRRAARTWGETHHRAAEDQAAAAGAEHARLSTAIAEAIDDRTAAQNGFDQPPPRPAHADAARDPGDGAPFYRLVAFHPDLSADQQAGLEASAQACGLLNAWVRADGRIADAALNDIVAASTTGPNGTANLSQLLVAAPDTDSPVTSDAVNALLACIRTGDSDDAAGLNVSVTGAWRAGVLHGAWTKPHPEYIGQTARAAARQRRISTLTELISQLTAAQAQAEASRTRAAATATAWHEHLDRLPHLEPLTRTRDKAADLEDKLGQLRRRAAETAGEHEKAHAAWASEQRVLAHDAAGLGLPANAEALDAVVGACRTVTGYLEQLLETLTAQWAPQLEELQAALEAHTGAHQAALTATEHADAAWSQYDQEAAALTALAESLTETAQQAQQTLADLKDEKEKIRRDLPGARRRSSEAVAAYASAEATYKNESGREKPLKADVFDAEDALTNAIDAPGLWHTLTGSADDPPADREDALAILEAIAPVPHATEAAVLEQHYNARAAMGTDRDLTTSTTHGILIVTVEDEDGPRPVADVARRTAERLARERSLLSERNSVILEKYLLQDLAEHLRGQIEKAKDLTERMNKILAAAESSQGVRVQLDWKPSPGETKDALEGLGLLTKNLAARTKAEDDRLRAVLAARIDAEADTNADYSVVLAQALDYRRWHTFNIKIQSVAADGSLRPRQIKALSSGERRMISYVTMFAAAASFYDVLEREDYRPLRIVPLDEAFERIDGPTITRLLELLVELNMDWIITWPGHSVISPNIPRYHVYDVLKRREAWGLAFVGTTWDSAADQPPAP